MVDGKVCVQCMMGDVVHGWCAVVVSGNQIHDRCLAGEDIACDVDEVLWPDPNRRRDPWAHVCTIAMIFCVYGIVFFLLLYYGFFFVCFFALSEFMVLQCTVLQCTILSRPICFFGCLKMCLLKICLLNKQWKSKTAVFYISRLLCSPWSESVCIWCKYVSFCQQSYILTKEC